MPRKFHSGDNDNHLRPPDTGLVPDGSIGIGLGNGEKYKTIKTMNTKALGKRQKEVLNLMKNGYHIEWYLNAETTEQFFTIGDHDGNEIMDISLNMFYSLKKRKLIKQNKSIQAALNIHIEQWILNQ